MKNFLIFCTLIVAKLSFAQEIKLTDVFSSSGSITVSAQLSLEWTLGETLIESYNNDNEGLLITQGLHQSFYESDPNPPIVDIEGLVVNSGSDTCFFAGQTIYVNDLLVEQGGDLILTAGVNIVFLSSIKIFAGGNMHAYITKDGSPCPDKSTPLLASSEHHDEYQLPNNDQFNSKLSRQNKIRLFPNPTSGAFSIEVPYYKDLGEFRLEIFSNIGERVFEIQLPASISTHSVDLTSQSPGLYLVRVIQGSNVYSAKVIKN